MSNVVKVKNGYEDKITIIQGRIEPTRIELRTKSTEDTKRLMDIFKGFGKLDGVWFNFNVQLNYGDDLD